MLAITGVNSPSERQAALDSGFDEVVVKPFNVESLLDQIEAFDQRTANR
jgi:DNA-binding response OmpR family regulator